MALPAGARLVGSAPTLFGPIAAGHSAIRANSVGAESSSHKSKSPSHKAPWGLIGPIR